MFLNYANILCIFYTLNHLSHSARELRGDRKTHKTYGNKDRKRDNTSHSSCGYMVDFGDCIAARLGHLANTRRDKHYFSKGK